jgi:hypothetical protein
MSGLGARLESQDESHCSLELGIIDKEDELKGFELEEEERRLP